ncbi:MAG: YtxH domain-containing protein [Marinirhabdus sp.]
MASNTGQTLLALLTGAAIGAGIGILYAPEKGTNTRKKINKETKKARKQFNKKINETTTQLSDKAQQAKLTFNEKLESTLASASHKADDILLAMEDKLEALRRQNAKLQKDVKTEQVKTQFKKATS